jgi:uncharacterized YigZ family protein
LHQYGALISFETPKPSFPFQMTESFFTIASPSRGTFKDRGSKFLAFAHPVADSEQIKTILAGLKKEYYDASHHCYAWVLGPDKSQFKVFDDGEPNHTAGDPIYGQIRARNLTNVLVIVVRYFGGTKLGVSGLITAYRAAAEDALNRATIIEEFITERFIIEFSYGDTSAVMALLKDCSAEIIKQEFAEACRIIVDLRIGQTQSFKNKIEILVATGIPVHLTQ